MFPKSFMHNNVEVRIVPDERYTETAFYVSKEGSYGIRLYPDGRRMMINGTTSTTINSKCEYDRRRKQRYLQFKNAWGWHKNILVSHAVYRAWYGKTIPEGMTIDHIDGCTTHNDFRNLRCVSLAINMRDGGFLRKLQHKGIYPTRIDRPYLLRYFDRMARLKPAISSRKYIHLTRENLLLVLYAPDADFEKFLCSVSRGIPRPKILNS